MAALEGGKAAARPVCGGVEGVAVGGEEGTKMAGAGIGIACAWEIAS